VGSGLASGSSSVPANGTGAEPSTVHPPPVDDADTLALLERIQRNLVPEPNSGCWIWTACVNRDGYGKISVSGRDRVAHRVAYELLVGPIPDGMQLDHLCRTLACVNPEHLEPVTPGENQRRGYAARGPVSHCKNGHEFTPDNTYSRQRNEGLVRECRQCHSERERDRRRRRKEQADADTLTLLGIPVQRRGAYGDAA